MNKNIIWAAAVVIVGAGAFWAGIQHAGGQAPSRQFGGQFQRQNAATRGLTAGKIISASPTSVTLQTQGGNSIIVFFATSTEILKSTAGTPKDLAAGADVLVMGTPNQDGSVTAQSIQIRPAMNAGGSSSAPQQP